MLIKGKVFLSFVMFLLPGTMMAQSPIIKPKVIKETIYSTINVGVDFIRMNGNQGLVLLSPYQDYYTGNQSYKASGSLGLGFGLERAVRSNYLWQLGLAGYFNTVVQASGHRWQFALPTFDNFSYRYQVQSSRVIATGKLLSTYYQKKYHPYISGELGVSFNRAFGYSEISLLEEESPMSPFTSRTQNRLSWGLGLGVDVDIRSGLRLGIGYQFADLGKASLGVSSDQQTNNSLSIPHLYDNQLRFQLTALT